MRGLQCVEDQVIEIAFANAPGIVGPHAIDVRRERRFRDTSRDQPIVERRDILPGDRYRPRGWLKSEDGGDRTERGAEMHASYCSEQKKPESEDPGFLCGSPARGLSTARSPGLVHELESQLECPLEVRLTSRIAIDASEVS